MDDERQEEELEEIEIEDEDEGEGEEPEEKPATYKELVSRVAVLSKMLRAHAAGQGKFDPTGVLTKSVLENLPAESERILRKCHMMEWTLQRVRQGFYSLIHAEALPSEGWDYAAKELIDSIEDALEIREEED